MQTKKKEAFEPGGKAYLDTCETELFSYYECSKSEPKKSLNIKFKEKTRKCCEHLGVMRYLGRADGKEGEGRRQH